jgi:hypothetical protein
MKRGLLAVWLLFFGLWPLAHFGLVKAYGIHPWRFGGWATFAAPALTTKVFLFQVDYGSAETLDDIRAIKLAPAYWSSRLRSEVIGYATGRTNFGRLVPPPERLGRKLLDEHGETGMVLVVVQTREIDRATGLLKTHIEKYPYSAARTDSPAQNPR